MNEIFDIFRRETDGSFKWVGAAETLALARQKVVQDPAASDYAFLIVNSATEPRSWGCAGNMSGSAPAVNNGEDFLNVF